MHSILSSYPGQLCNPGGIKKREMKKLIVTLTAVAFTAGSLGFMGCSSEIAEDPNAVNAKEPEQKDEENPEMTSEKGGDGGGTLKLKGKKPDGGGNLDN